MSKVAKKKVFCRKQNIQVPIRFRFFHVFRVLPFVWLVSIPPVAFRNPGFWTVHLWRCEYARRSSGHAWHGLDTISLHVYMVYDIYIFICDIIMMHDVDWCRSGLVWVNIAIAGSCKFCWCVFKGLFEDRSKLSIGCQEGKRSLSSNHHIHEDCIIHPGLFYHDIMDTPKKWMMAPGNVTWNFGHGRFPPKKSELAKIGWLSITTWFAVLRWPSNISPSWWNRPSAQKSRKFCGGFGLFWWGL